MWSIGTSGLVATGISILMGYIIIPFLIRLNAGQFIREEGPKSHHSKAGTPTMGGVIFILAWSFCLVFFWGINKQTLILIFATFFFGGIGFLDDYIKVVLKRNLGLRAYQKVIGQLIGSAILIFMIGLDQTVVYIPGLDFFLDLKWAYYPFAFFFIVAVTNSVNLTDGLDGLASLVTIVFLASMSLIAAMLPNHGIVMSNVLLAFSLLGFLYFNRFPAKVFMGDVGSLALGGYLAAMVMLLQAHLLFVIVGGVYVVETLSVVLQVFWFKKTGKRLFKMAPIHHHFEQLKWSEIKIVSVFTAVACALGALGYWIVL